MRVRTYNNLGNNFARDMANWNAMMNRMLDRNWGYDYAGNGGQTGQGIESAEEEGFTNATLLPLDIWTTPESFKISAYVPGVNPEDVEITIEGEELTIRGHLPAVEEEGEAVKRELYHGNFARRVTFNVPVNSDGIEAHFTNGLLTLLVPKAEAVRPKTIKIQAK